MTLSGMFPAVITPLDPRGAVDLDTFDRVFDFVLTDGVAGVCIGGATSEYPHFELEERKALIRRAGGRLPPGKALLTAIGASSLNRVLELGACAVEAGSRALLLPMPGFFQYQQQDLEAFCRHVNRTLQAPCLLYDLPDFTNPLEASTTVGLLESEPHIVGIKDSSGERGNLPRFIEARNGRPWSLLVGDDGLLLPALEAGWDGAISGIAGMCPELLAALYGSVRQRDWAAARRYQALLDELIAQVARFPTPWGVRIGLHVRGIDNGMLPLPLSSARREQIAGFQKWLSGWLEQAPIPNLQDAPS